MNKNFFFIFTLLISCKQTYKSEEPINYVYSETVTLEDNNLISFELGKNIALSNSVNFHALNINETELIMFSNSYTHSVLAMDVSNRNLLKQIVLEYDGENGIGELDDQNSLIYSKNGEILSFNGNSGYFYYLDNKSNIVHKKNLYDYDSKGRILYPYISETSYMIKLNNDIYIPSFNKLNQDFFLENTIMKYSLVDNNLSTIMQYPEIYKKGFWGVIFKYAPKLTTNNKDKILISFPIDPYVYALSESGEILSKNYIPSKHIKRIEPMYDNIRYTYSSNRDWEKEKIYSLSNFEYSALHYDEYRDLYYRIVFIRKSLEDVKRGEVVPDFSIIVFNDKLEKIGETEVLDGKKYDSAKMVILKEGLAIVRLDLYKENDSELSFSVFKISENR